MDHHQPLLPPSRIVLTLALALGTAGLAWGPAAKAAGVTQPSTVQDVTVTLVATFGKGEPVQVPLRLGDPKTESVMVSMVERVQMEAWRRRTVGAIEVVGLCHDQSRGIARTLGKTALQAALGGKTMIAWPRLVVAIRGSVDVEGPALSKFLAKGPYEPGTVVVGEDLSRDGAECGAGLATPNPGRRAEIAGFLFFRLYTAGKPAMVAGPNPRVAHGRLQTLSL